MINHFPQPALLPPQISVPFENLVFMSAAIPFRMDGVAVVGDPEESAPKLPTIIRLDASRKDVPAVEYEGSALLRGLLDSSPEALVSSPIPLIDVSDGMNDAFIKVANGGARVRDLIAGSRRVKGFNRFGYTYGQAAAFFDKLEAAGERLAETSPQFVGVSDLLRRISPMAWEVAQRALNDGSRINDLPHASYLKHCLLFIAGALGTSYRDVVVLQYAIQAMGKVSDYFEVENDVFGDGEGLAVKASIHEIIAEVLEVHRLEERDVGWGMYPERFLYGAAKAWRDYLKSEAAHDRKGAYMRALNAAQTGRRYDVMGDLFEAASGFEEDDLDSARFLVRAVWAMLKNYTGDRSDAERWHAVSLLAGRAENLFLSSGITDAELIATQARMLSSEAYDLAEELARKN